MNAKFANVGWLSLHPLGLLPPYQTFMLSKHCNQGNVVAQFSPTIWKPHNLGWQVYPVTPMIARLWWWLISSIRDKRKIQSTANSLLILTPPLEEFGEMRGIRIRSTTTARSCFARNPRHAKQMRQWINNIWTSQALKWTTTGSGQKKRSWNPPRRKTVS